MRRRGSLLGLLLTWIVGCAAAVGKPALPVVDPHPPASLAEALDRLEQTLPPETIQKMRAGTEAEMVKYHFGLGRWMRNNWGLWAHGPLYQYFVGLGLRHPDDMSGIILTSLWRRLHGQPLRVEDEVARYQEYWRVTVDPDPRSNPPCRSPITTTLSMSPDAPDDRLRGVHMGTCCADGHVWSYHVDRGWYEPTEAELAIWKQDSNRYHPCKK